MNNDLHIIEQVLLPYIQKIRENLGEGYDPESHVIDDAFKAVSWVDGDLPQIAAITRADSLAKDEKLKLDANKHAASASGTQQSADLCPNFRGMKQAFNQLDTITSCPQLSKCVNDLINQKKKSQNLYL